MRRAFNHRVQGITTEDTEDTESTKKNHPMVSVVLSVFSVSSVSSVANPLPRLPFSAMEHVEGRLSVVAALRAYQRRFQVVLVRHDAHEEKVQEVLDAAAERGVPVRRVEGRELDALAHGSSHGGVLAICSAKPRMKPEALIERLARAPTASLLL